MAFYVEYPFDGFFQNGSIAYRLTRRYKETPNVRNVKGQYTRKR